MFAVINIWASFTKIGFENVFLYLAIVLKTIIFMWFLMFTIFTWFRLYCSLPMFHWFFRYSILHTLFFLFLFHWILESSEHPAPVLYTHSSSETDDEVVLEDICVFFCTKRWKNYNFNNEDCNYMTNKVIIFWLSIVCFNIIFLQIL